MSSKKALLLSKTSLTPNNIKKSDIYIIPVIAEDYGWYFSICSLKLSIQKLKKALLNLLLRFNTKKVSALVGQLLFASADAVGRQ